MVVVEPLLFWRLDGSIPIYRVLNLLFEQQESMLEKMFHSVNERCLSNHHICMNF